jgi:SAM-dependent methyltransferase
MTGVLYRWAQWRHTVAKRDKDPSFRIEPAIAILRQWLLSRPGMCTLDLGPRNAIEPGLLRTAGFGTVEALDLFPQDPGIRRGDIEAMPYPASTFDLVVCSHVLEHSYDLQRAADEIIRVTTPGGLVWIAVPAGQAPTAHDRHRFDTADDVVRLFGRAVPDVLFAETRAGRDVRVLLRLRKDGPKRILYLVPDAMAMRNVEASGLLRRLTECGHRVDLACGTQGPTLIPGITAGALAPFLGAPWKRYLRRHWLRTLCYLARARKGERTYQAKLSLRRPRRRRIELAVLRPLDRWVNGERVARRIERWLPEDRTARRLVAELRPDVVIAHTSLYEGLEAETFKAAKRLRIPTIAQIASWDSATSKGPMLIESDVVAVWGEASRAHLVERHGFAPACVVVTGPCHMDAYAEPGPTFPVEAAPTILFVGTTVAYFAEEQELVARIGQWADARRVHVWYRPHPRMLATPLRVTFRHNVIVDRDGLDTPPAAYRRLLARAACVVTAFSTMVIEAALMGKPSLLVAFGATTGGTEHWVSAAGVHTVQGRLVDHAGFEHMAEVINKPGVRVCRSETALFQGLEDHAVHRVQPYPDELRAWAARIAHCLDGNATQRMVDLIERVAK